MSAGERRISPVPETERYKGCDKLKGKIALITGGDSGIGRAVAIAFEGQPMLLDYSSTKGAIVAFTRSLSLSLVKQGIRVNAVAPGPIWTPLIPATFDANKSPVLGLIPL